MNMNYFVPTRLFTGKNCVKEHSDNITSLGKKCLIVTSLSAAKKSGALDDILSVLDENNSEYIIYDKIQQNPTVASCIEAGKEACDFGADYIIGIGGGSPLDASKIIAMVSANSQITEAEMYAMQWKSKPLPIVTVGTTAGTGSEVTSVSVLTNGNGLKKSIRHDDLYPTVSFGDPKYTMSLPDSFTRSTAVDALSHCVESFFNRNANDISKVFALAGTKKLLHVFDKMISQPELGLDYDDREQIYNASILGGLAISITGTAFPHALGYFLTENYGIAHGTACAVYIPSFIEHNIINAPKLAIEFFDEMRIDSDTFNEMVKKITPECGVNLTPNDIKLLSPRWENNKSLKKNFGNVDREYVDKLLERLFADKEN